MTLVLMQWSAVVQLASVMMVAAFFAVLARSSRRAEVQWWGLAWFANLGALLVTAYFWIAQPTHLSVWQGFYLGLKLAFVLWLLQGAWAVGRPGTELLSQRTIITAAVAYGFIGGLFIPSVQVMGLVGHLVMGLLLIGGTLALGREWRNVAWLSSGLCLRGSLAFLEAGAYWISMNAAGQYSNDLRTQVGWFLAGTSSFDAGVEWFVALGCVLAYSERAQRELTTTNYDLRQAQEHLRRVADRDPLTALDNRRTLPDVFLNVQPDGASVLFLDLDGFKQINDLYGHAVGDQCLVRVATAIRESFRPGDAIVRYGGDEFLVVAGGMDAAAAMARVESLRVRLAAEPEPRIEFSCGLAELVAGGSPQSALHAADRAMYQVKRRA